MTVHAHPMLENAVAAADAWFSALSPLYLGRLEPDDPLLTGGAMGWLVSTLSHHLAVVVDPAFPFTRPRVYIRGRSRPSASQGQRPPLPTKSRDPLRSASRGCRGAGEARNLLRAIAKRSEDDDFQEDFTLYWQHRADTPLRARLLLPHVTDPRPHLDRDRFRRLRLHFAGGAPAMVVHRFGTERRRWSRRVIVLHELPHPDVYPDTGAERWIHRGSLGGRG